MPTKVLYEISARATGGRDGRAVTTDGSLDLKLTTPKELGGPGGDGNNPEQLFAAGYAGCFLNAMKFIALKSRSSFPADASVTATVGIGPNADGGFGLAIALAVSLPGLSDADAKNLMEQAHEVCPYSNATRNNIEVKLGLGWGGAMPANLPKPVEAFIAATHARDSRALMATFSGDAVLADMGKTHRGDEIRAWNDSLFIGANVSIRVLDVKERDGKTIVTVMVDGDCEQFGVTEPFELDWYFTVTDDKISALTMIEEKKPAATKEGNNK